MFKDYYQYQYQHQYRYWYWYWFKISSSFHNSVTTKENIWSPAACEVTRLVLATLRRSPLVCDLRVLLGSYNIIKSQKYLGIYYAYI